MSESGKFDALIAIGALIRSDSGTCHFEVPSSEPANYINEVQLECGVPVADAILTTDTHEQAIERMNIKGGEAALVAIEIVNLLRSFV